MLRLTLFNEHSKPLNQNLHQCFEEFGKNVETWQEETIKTQFGTAAQ